MKIPGWNLGGVGKPVSDRPWRTPFWKRPTYLFPPKTVNTSAQIFFKISFFKKIFRAIQKRTQSQEEETEKRTKSQKM